MITVKELHTQKEMKQFVTFPFGLYKDNAYWVPPMINDEVKSFDRSNKIFETVDVKFYMAYKDNQPVGRVAAIINWTEVKEMKKAKVRFGWFDFVDDKEVSKALIQKVYAFGKENNLEYMEGPMGFSNMDKAGMLTQGFEYMPTMIGMYNHAYYPAHLTALGFTPEAEWLEFSMKMKDIVDNSDLPRMAAIIERRFEVKTLDFKTIKDVLPYVDEMFGLLNKSYASLQSYVPIEQYQIDFYKEKYIKFIHPDFISCVVNKEGKLVGFAITMPSFSKAFKKANGSLFPFGWYHLLQAIKKNDHAEFYLIGIDPDYQNKGLNALMFRDLTTRLVKRNILTVETNPLLEENLKVQQLWKDYHPITHKKRKTYRKDL